MKRERVPWEEGRLMAAGALSGAITKTATAPLERAKILLQIQHMRHSGPELKYQGVRGTLLRIVREEGVLALFKVDRAMTVPRSIEVLTVCTRVC